MGTCLDLPGSNTENGNFLWTWECLGSPNQQWLFDTHGQLTTKVDAQKCVDLPNNDGTEGNPIAIWDCSGAPQQAWGYDRNGGGTIYLSQSLDASLCMHVKDESGKS